MNLLIVFVVLVILCQVQCQSFIQPTALDIFTQQYRDAQSFVYRAFGRNSEDKTNIARAKAMKMLQHQVPLSTSFPCNTTGFRSKTPPINVNQVRPGDVDIVAALGDSISVGNGLVATDIFQVFIGNRGIAWCIGGQGTWREFLTLPNILKEFNPNLFGFSLRDSLIYDKESQFNLAEFAALSSEMPYTAKTLIERMNSDPRVDIKNHWKLITIMIGINNFCLDICYQSKPEDILIFHRNDLLNTFRLLKKHLPRTIINLVPTPDATRVKQLRPLKPTYCQFVNIIECFCMLQPRFSNQTTRYAEIMQKWRQIEEEISNMDEFNTKDFTIIFQPFTLNFKIPRKSNGKIDPSNLAPDCHHISQKLGAAAANSLWNNMLEPFGNKTKTNTKLFERFLCPSEKNPYIFTKTNSRQ